MALSSRPLCRVSITLEAGAPIAVGASPWRNRRVSHIAGGSIGGERLRGTVEPGGGDWSELGTNPEGDGLTLLDVRSLWKTHDGARIYVAYQGRLVIPSAVLPAFRDPEALKALDPAHYYFRITPLFETADPRYFWLNGIVAAGIGTRTPDGVDYDIHELL
ncbi:DUF3237 domain-containing protein [Sphingosinicella microcystinivorans]|uniref:DUF3237 domain-containing protein n=1 Tax=Sphingosinicella microcystinivorans TaxID=335406 RepID=UPI0022F3CD6D|nr:DUF3237 domain-containing protein [Sphingosinicella microcystinivorans]WBX84633.1 DUF3237 domain-containing protein [Sphingosinicella microcystinivorans]